MTFRDASNLLRTLAGRAKVLAGDLARDLRGQVLAWLRRVQAAPRGTSPAGAAPPAGGQTPAGDASPAGGAANECVTASQLSFLASLTGLAVAAADAAGRIRLADVQALKDFFRSSFPYSEEDQLLLSRLVDETFLARERLGVDELARHFASASSPAGRRLLVRLLLKIACTERPGVPPAEEWLVRRIAGTLGLAPEEYDTLAAEFLPQSGWEYRLLGLEPGASEGEVRTAYRRLASVSHPDRFTSLGGESVRVAEEKFKLLQEAYEEIRRGRGPRP